MVSGSCIIECKHGMNPNWCATCKGLKTPEEEQEELDKGELSLWERLNAL